MLILQILGSVFLQKPGFTLFEVLISLSILMLLYFSVSSFTVKHKQVVLGTIVSEINSALRFAKFYALAHGKVSVVCMVANDCTHGLRVVSSSSQLIREFAWPRNTNLIVWHGFASSRGPTFAANFKSSAANGSYKLMQDEQVLLKLVVNRFGRTRIVD